MNRNTDVLLINSFAPRQRIASDTALENSLPLIRTYLLAKGFNAHIWDDQRIEMIEAGVPSWITNLLRLISSWMVITNGKGWQTATFLLILLAWPFQSYSIYRRKKYMEDLAQRIIEFIKKEHIPLVGIKIWYGDAYTWAVSLAKRIRKECPQTFTVAGGPHAKVYGEYLIADSAFDFVIMGPGEETLAHFMTLKQNASDKDTWYKLIMQSTAGEALIRTGQYNPGELPSGYFTIPEYQASDLSGKLLLHTLVDGVGCSWNQCNFCSHTRQRISYTPRPLAQIQQEIETMLRKGISFFRFSSSETPLYHGKAIANMLLEKNLAIRYSMFARAGRATPETLHTYRLMIQSGLRAVFIGGETGHDVINSRIMNKGVTAQDIIGTIQCIRLAASEVGQPCRIGLSLIYPCPVTPEVSIEDVFNANLNLITQALPDTVIVNPPGVFPGTAWYEHASSFGFSFDTDFIKHLMAYEYSIYKPVEQWQSLNLSLNDMTFTNILKQSGKFSAAVEKLGIPVGVSDELLMMSDAIGISSYFDLMEFKRNSLIDIMSGSNSYLKEVSDKMNKHSRQLAYSNMSSLSQH